MAKRRKGQPERTTTPIEALMGVWKKYGTLLMGGLALVLIIILVVNWTGRRAEGRLEEAKKELADIAADDPNRLTRLMQLEHEYGDTEIGPKVRMELSWEHLRQRDYAKAEPLLNEFLAAPDSMPAYFKARARLGLAYVAMDRKKYDEARTLFETVKRERLYATEAERMLAVIGKAKTAPVDSGPRPAGKPTETRSGS